MDADVSEMVHPAGVEGAMQIRAVHYHWRRVSEPSYDGVPGTTIEMNISVGLIDGERLKLTDSFPDGLTDAIDDARAARAGVERDSERDRAAVAHGERTGPEWLHLERTPEFQKYPPVGPGVSAASDSMQETAPTGRA